MDIIIRQEDISVSQVALYATISFMIVSLMGAIAYITCSKKYRLNWFEKTLLETATESEEINESREALVGGTSGYNVDTISECSRKGNVSPTSTTDDPTFWVPPPKPGTSSQVLSSADESPPATPTSPTGSTKSATLSTGSGSVPLVRSDKHIVLGMTPSRPKVSSMNAKLDHTKIDMSLYKSSSLQKSSSTPSTEEVRGTIHLSMLYDPIAGILSVRLIEAQNLLPQDFSGTADPYAKIRLLPDKKNVWQTRIHKKTLNPVFDEDFVFEEHPAVIEKRVVEILLYDFDAYSRHVCIGGVQIPLSSLDLSDKVDLWTQLGTCAEQDSKIDLGDIMVSLAYLPSAERLTVVIIKARNLRVVDDGRNSSDPYVKVTLISGGKKIKKRKTGVYRSSVNPVFNEALTFDVQKEVLKNSFLEFTVIHDGLLGSSEILGRAFIGNSPDVRIDEKIFFEEMFRSKSATAEWVPLQDVITKSLPNANQTQGRGN